MGPCGPGGPCFPSVLCPGGPGTPAMQLSPSRPSRPGGPGCPSLPSFPGSPGRQDAVVTGQVSAASVVRYTAVKQVRATRNLTVRGGICHLQLFFSSMLQPIARCLLRYTLFWELLLGFACLLALIC